MANFQTVSDLKTDALWLAGEPTSGSSSFDSRSVEYLNATLLALYGGGALGEIALDEVDWYWIRTLRGMISLAIEYDDSVQLATGSTVGLFDAVVSPSKAGYHIYFPGRSVVSQIPKITAHTTGTNNFTIDANWIGATFASPESAKLAKLDYTLPTDFVRPLGPLTSARFPHEVVLMSAPAFERKYPLAHLRVGFPLGAAIIDQTTLRVSHIPSPTDNPYYLELDYVGAPPTLSTGGADPAVPKPHRRILSLGSGYLMLLDKGDSRATSVERQFVAAWEAMRRDHMKMVDDHLGDYCSIRPWPNKDREPIRTESGLIVG